MASDEIPVGSKWRHREFGHERTVKALVSEPPTPDAIANYGRVPCVLWTEGNGPTPFDRVSTVLGKFTRIDQPKAEDPVPVGSRWKFEAAPPVVVVGIHPDGIRSVSYEHAPDGARFFYSVEYLLDNTTRIDTPSPPITDPGPPWTPDAFERAVVGALSRRPKPLPPKPLPQTCCDCGVNFSEARTTPIQRSGDDWICAKCYETCRPGCGPASPCLATQMCRDRDRMEMHASVMTDRLNAPFAPGCEYEFPRSVTWRFAPPAPSPVGLGSLVGQYRVSVERKRVR